MKKRFLIIFFSFCALFSRAQVSGGFNCADPNAWFDKEIYFVAYNGMINYWGYGMNLSNVQLCVNGEKWFYLRTWNYGTYATLKDCGLEKGSVVKMYVNGQYYAQWVCNESQPSLSSVFYRAYHDYKISKRVYKFIKKIK